MLLHHQITFCLHFTPLTHPTKRPKKILTFCKISNYINFLSFVKKLIDEQFVLITVMPIFKIHSLT